MLDIVIRFKCYNCFYKDKRWMEQNKGKSDIEKQVSAKDMEIRQKKAMLYNLKNKLLKYDSFENVPIEELQTLCESITQQNQSNHSHSSNSIDLDRSQKENPMPVQGNESSSQTNFALPTLERCCRNVYVIKLKQILIIVLVIACIVVKNAMPTSGNYDMGDFTIYQTKYEKSSFVINQQNQTQSHLFARMFGINKQEQKIKLYLPKSLQKMKKKDQQDISYQKCINLYQPLCIDHHLSLYGSINLELQQWVLDHITGKQKIVFESKIEYLLSIVLSTMKMKKLQLQGKPIQKITLMETDNMNQIQLNSIKLSLIDNQCHQLIQIVKIKPQQYDFFAQYSYVFVSQEFYILYVYPFGQNPSLKYPSSSFVILMPRGLNDSLKILLKQSPEQAVQEIEFSKDGQKFYSQKQIGTKQLVMSEHSQKMRIFIINHSRQSQHIIQDIQINELKQDQQANAEDEQRSETGQQLPKQLFIDQHPCIKQNTYDVLPIVSYFDMHTYVDTVLGFKLLVHNNRTTLYKTKGAISPQLLFFIQQNIGPKDTVFFPYQLYQDDLVLLTIAKAVSNIQHFYCITPQIDQPILSENLRMNGFLKSVSFAFLSINEEQKIHKYYDQSQFNVFFMSLLFLKRDYESISLIRRPKIVIIYWQFDINNLQFVKKLAGKHKVWSILQRFEKINVGDACFNYGMVQASQQNILQLDRSWLIVQM